MLSKFFSIFDFFFNNLGKSNSKSSHDSEAVYVGVVGARFEHPNRMEWQEIILEEDLKKTDGNEMILYLKRTLKI